jgi:hypothetical protein
LKTTRRSLLESHHDIVRTRRYIPGEQRPGLRHPALVFAPTFIAIATVVGMIAISAIGVGEDTLQLVRPSACTGRSHLACAVATRLAERRHAGDV